MRSYQTDLVADYFLARANPEFGDALSNLKLQKLCYYAAGLIAAVRPDDEPPLFDDPIKAWQHGPVVPSQYHRFSGHKSDTIPHVAVFDFDQFDAPDLAILDDVNSFYGQYSAWKLRNMTHEEEPWINAYNQPNGNTITTAALRDYFRSEVSGDYISSYRAQQG
ncbi:DUF4065 domain-containing protein [Phyllobacterium sp. 0TCS1.6C]|uniref:Panacea domain-containing protein n=1 Tax=unclassified Phyllobacterium TaxID=2638441 RepID=UPI00226551F2|nr:MULTISPECIES: type II toxin-antitoxin system antitoxin SocA domain-containing protein [unclassified Phyllobacterium]MCX8281445.1 DUF4065 domain-containing protein [Phyllobacterium sp. 0TCS1.6C]MCX8292959.1 DUF4065 domain-containing protein [Phyllobacterium sp. 0TCS1.6A]